jgi:two-component system cell cycle sensor histidine kinase/response regulator CckA
MMSKSFRGPTLNLSLLRSWVQAFPDVSLVLNPLGAVVYYHVPGSAKFPALEDVMNRNIREILPATVLKEVELAVADAAQGHTRTVEFEQDIQGARQIFESRFAPMEGAGVLAIIRNSVSAQLREKAQLQAAILESAAHAIVVTDLEGSIEWVNPAFTSLSQYSAEEAIGKNPRVLVKSGVHDKAFYKDLWDTILDGQVWRGEIVNRRKDGSLYHEDQMITPLRNEHGEIRHFAAIKQDITARRLGEDALQKAEEDYRKLVNEVNDGIFVVDATGKFTFVNGPLANIHGFSDPSELIGRNVVEFLEPERARELQAQAFSGHPVAQPETLTERLLLPGGGEKFVEIKPVPIIEDGRVTGFRGVVRDVDGRVRTEKELQLSYNVLSEMHNVVYVANSDGTVVYVSPSAERILGYSPDDLLGEGWWNLTFVSADHAASERSTAAARARGEAEPRRESFERSVKTKDGSTRLMLFTESATSDNLVIRAASDITEHRRLEEQLRQAQKMEAVGLLAGGVAHDFNNLLTVINGYSEILLNRIPVGDPIRASLTSIQQAGVRATLLTRQLLAFSRKQIIVTRVLDLNIVVNGMEKMLGRVIGEDIELSTVLDPSLGAVMADAGQIEQVLMNLVVNARDAMPRGGKLTIETHNVRLDESYAGLHYGVHPGQFAMLAITDNGCGMDETVKNHLFEPFFTTKDVGKGTGLGLSVVHGIVQQSGGHVRVYSEIGSGTTFKIYLPHVDHSDDSVSAETDTHSIPQGNETILLVEDEPGVRGLARYFLESCGYRVLEAESGQQAIKVTEVHPGPIHLVITDVVMPNLGGRALAEYFNQTRPDSRVLFVSGYTDDTVVRHGILEADFPFLQKPFTAANLAQKVREVLDKAPRQTSE